MKMLKVGAAVLNQTPLDWTGNVQRIGRAIEMARVQQVQVLVLPELCICGYGCEDAFHSAGLRQTAWRFLQQIAPQTRGMIVSVGLPVLYQNGLFNTACLLVDGRIAGFAAKRFLAGDGIHYEPRWFKPWPTGCVAELTHGDQSYPLGDVYFDCGGIKLGFEICEDAWVAQRPGSSLALQGVDLILNPSASHFAFGKYATRQRFVLEGSRAFGVTYVYSNLVGNESGRAIYDGGALIASGGRMLAAGARFSFADVQLTTALVDLDATRMSQARTGSFSPALQAGHDACVRVPYAFTPHDPASQALVQQDWESGPCVKEEEFTRAVALALFDYLRKSRSQGFVVSLSGGADSSAVATLAACLVHLGIGELGADDFRAKLGYMANLSQDANGIIRALLTCVYQPTENSSQTTRNAARGVSAALGATFLELNVGGLAQEYVALVENAIGRKLDWEHDDLALQNIQARTRAPGVWLLANLKNALLLATSNRSEAAVGYATMDGDTCGGLSPIAGIDKAFLRHWLRWMERQGPAGLFAFPVLAAVNVQPPTAELRPPTAGQTDEQDLMPYDVLDGIERLAIRDKQTPVEVWKLAQSLFPQHSKQQLAFWVERFFRLWCRNQWKRERYAPSFHLDDENLDPKTWCRFPILSGAYEFELAELRKLSQPAT